MLLCPDSYYSPHDRLINQETGFGARNSNFKRKARSLKKITDVFQISSLSGVSIQVSFILTGERVKSDISCFRSAFGGDVLISFSLKSFTGGSGHNVSWELNKGILA